MERDKTKNNNTKKSSTVDLNSLMKKVKEEERKSRRNSVMVSTAAISAITVFGIILTINLEVQNELWLNLKFVAVFFLSAFHMYCARIRKVFESGQNKKSDKYYRWINEVPTILFLVIVFLVVFKPIV